MYTDEVELSGRALFERTKMRATDDQAPHDIGVEVVPSRGAEEGGQTEKRVFSPLISIPPQQGSVRFQWPEP